MAKNKNLYDNTKSQTPSEYSGLNGIEEVGDKVEAPIRTIPTSQAALAIYKNLRDRNLKRLGGFKRFKEC